MKTAFEEAYRDRAKSAKTDRNTDSHEFETLQARAQFEQIIEQSALRYVCLVVSVALLAFGVSNLSTGDSLLGLIDVLLAVIMLIIAILSRHSQVGRWAGLAALIAGATVVIMAIYSNSYGVYWAYVTAVASFLVVNRRVALIYNIVLILIVTPMTAEMLSIASSIRVAVTLSLITIFTHIFSRLIAERTTALLQHMQELREANLVKSEFIANMSHEMRTPLTTVLGYSESLLDANDLSKVSREKLEAIVFGARHLARLIDDVLDISKAENGHLEVRLEKTELVPLMKSLMSALEPAAQAKKIELRLTTGLPMPRFIETDPIRLNQILMNLVGNAIKFTETGSVKLSVEYHASNKTVVFCVIDTGIGIAKDFREELFEQFSQAESKMNRAYGGTGLGLYISRKLATLLQGDLQYIPQQRGSKFQLSIKTGEVAIEGVSSGTEIDDTQSTDPQPAEQFSGHILIAEDSSVNQLLIGLLVEKVGLTHSLVSNGLEAIERLRAEHFDLVLMDLQMPIMSGIEATQAIREFNRDIPIVALSADVLRYDQGSEAMEGFTEFLAKPIDIIKMRTMLARLLPIINPRNG